MIRRIALGNTINDSLVCLSKAQETTIDTIETMQQWEINHYLIEKNAFDIMNNTDRALKLSQEGQNLVNLLNSTYISVLANPNKENLDNLNNIIEKVIENFQSIQSTENISSDIAHDLENRIANQGNVGLSIKSSLEHVEAYLNQTVARTELDWM